MTKFLISFPSSAMNFTPDVIAAASEDSRAVVQAAKDAGVWVFGGAINEGIAPVLISGDGSVTDGASAAIRDIDGGFCVLEVPSAEVAMAWAAKIATACRCPQEVRAFHYDPES